MPVNNLAADPIPFSGAAAFVEIPGEPHLKLVEMAFVNLIAKAQPYRAPFGAIIGRPERSSRKTFADIFQRNDIKGIALDGMPETYGCPRDDSKILRAMLALRSGVDAAGRCDLIVLDVGDLGGSLDLFTHGSFTPAILLCCDVGATPGWSSRRAQLLSSGYLTALPLGAHELFMHPAGIDHARLPAINSFDVFDTLIARRCIEPWRVFAMVGERMGLPDFVEQRRAAEQRVINRIYTFADIYAELGAHYQIDAATLEAIRSCELACERDVAIPIAENLARVEDGDVLISDMYLGETEIRPLLAEAKLDKSVGLIVSSHGKSAGFVWPKIQEAFSIRKHLGDNPHADGVMANRAGIASELTRVSDPNVVETMFIGAGLHDLGRLCREARLATWHADPHIRMLQIIQTSINFPMLLLASIHLARAAEQIGCAKLLFCSRDCNLWHPLFDAVSRRIGFKAETSYFMTSRMARITASPAYRRYAIESLKGDGMIVDLCGTGWSTANLIEKLGLRGRHTYFIDHRAPLALYENKVRTPDTCVTLKLLKTPHNLDNALLECANYATHPMCIDMRDVNGALVPVYDPDVRTSRELAMVEAQQDAFRVAMRAMDRYGLEDTFRLDDASLDVLCMSLYGYLHKQAAAFNVFAPSFHAENTTTVNRLLTGPRGSSGHV